MYRNQHRHGRIDPASLAIAVTLSAALIGGLVTSSPSVKAKIERSFEAYSVPIDEPPPPDPVPLAKAAPHQRTVSLDMPKTIVPQPPTATDFMLPPQPPGPVTIDLGNAGTGGGVVMVDPPRPAPVLVEPGLDPRYANLLQPPYPSEEQRAGREGRVTVRVLVGVDGRVRQVEEVSATSDAFFRAVRSQALARWRFKPGTRDGIPVEAWRTMSLRFVLEG